MRCVSQTNNHQKVCLSSHPNKPMKYITSYKHVPVQARNSCIPDYLLCKRAGIGYITTLKFLCCLYSCSLPDNIIIPLEMPLPNILLQVENPQVGSFQVEHLHYLHYLHYLHCLQVEYSLHVGLKIYSTQLSEQSTFKHSISS